MIADVGSTKSVKAIVPMPLMTPERPMAVRATPTSEHRREIRGLHADRIDAHHDGIEDQQPLRERAPIERAQLGEARQALRTENVGDHARRESSRISECGTEPRASNEWTPRRNR